jgi:ribulose-5-phosphate 4-epimerase/fuculose-1-phosphate aldolase
MAVKSVSKTSPVRQSCSEAEWQARVELAACHRLMHYYGVRDLTHNHLTARVPGEPDHFLIKPGDFMFDEVTASSLIKYDFDGNPVDEGHPKLRGGGLVIHAGLFAARPDINACFHTHTPANMGVASQVDGLLPINQHSMHFVDAIAYHDFGGFEFDIDMRAPLIKDLGTKTVALLRNHGSLVCGETIGEAFVEHHFLEIACQGQIAALSGNREIVLIPREIQERAAAQRNKNTGPKTGGKDWVSALRQAERIAPEHAD